MILKVQTNNDRATTTTAFTTLLRLKILHSFTSKTMSTAAERAAARRKAILNRGNDRLAKLTTSARGEDATYLRDGIVDLLLIY